MRSSLTILLFFVLGLGMGYFNWAPDIIIENDLSHWALYLLLFVVGVGVSTTPNTLKTLGSFSYRILLVPLFAIVGTTLGVVAVYLVLSHYNFRDLLAIGYGFGYYSLSSIFISELRSEELGVIALLANIMREIFTLLLAPLMVVVFGKLAPITSGGATSMDTTLPIITKASGKEYAVIAIVHGLVLSILVPFLVTLVLA